MRRQIFRQRAVEQYNARLERIALPRYADAPWLLIWWLFSGLLLAAVLLIWAARTPIYLTAPAVMVPAPTTWPTSAQVVVAVFLPAASGGQVAPAQRVQLQFAGLAKQTIPAETYQVTEVTPIVLSPQAARRLYALDASAGLLIEAPVTVALIELDGVPTTWLGSIGEAQIEVGSQSGLTLLPGLAAWLQ